VQLYLLQLALAEQLKLQAVLVASLAETQHLEHIFMPMAGLWGRLVAIVLLVALAVE
jgi:hypothetical protein